MHRVVCDECGAVRKWEEKPLGLALCSQVCVARWRWRIAPKERRKEIEVEMMERIKRDEPTENMQ
jgi:hypothetical protein